MFRLAVRRQFEIFYLPFSPFETSPFPWRMKKVTRQENFRFLPPPPPPFVGRTISAILEIRRNSRRRQGLSMRATWRNRLHFPLKRSFRTRFRTDTRLRFLLSRRSNEVELGKGGKARERKEWGEVGIKKSRKKKR